MKYSKITQVVGWAIRTKRKDTVFRRFLNTPHGKDEILEDLECDVKTKQKLR
jgi:hypothetical protein